MFDPLNKRSFFVMLFISVLLVNVIGNNSLGATTNVINNSVAGANPVITWNHLISQIGMEEKLPTTTLIRAYSLGTCSYL